jgi:toxin ParE1/3/4
MPRVYRFRQAEEDLLAIARFIAQDNPSAASRWLDEVERILSLVATQPLMGEAVDRLRPGLRRILHGNYLLFYEPLEDGIGLVRVVHGSRQIEKLFEAVRKLFPLAGTR